MNSVAPYVRHMLLCDDVQRSPTDPRKVIIYGLLSSIHPTAAGAAFPL